MITVDCGISGVKEVDYANELGLDTIITDHHEPLENLPKAEAVINPKIKNSQYPFRELAGVGVVFKLIQAIAIKLELEAKEYLKYLDLVCLGTISDIVPLVSENRVITKLGLKLIEAKKNPVLNHLIEASGFQKVNSGTISFGIAPRINACGRMGFADDALKLFVTQDKEKIHELTDKLNTYNQTRQELEKQILEEALEEIETKHENEKAVIVLSKENWHHGVIGIVASKITDKYLKPTILLCEEDGICKGSGRSVPGLDLHEALNAVEKQLEKYGGHSMAVGVSLKKENLERFKANLNQYVQDLGLEEIKPILNIDMEVTLKELSLQEVKELAKLEPFGEANQTPLFLIRNLKIEAIRAITEGKHLKLRLKEENLYLDAIGFNLGEYTEHYKLGDKVDIVGYLDVNSYHGMETIQMNLKDINQSL